MKCYFKLNPSIVGAVEEDFNVIFKLIKRSGYYLVEWHYCGFYQSCTYTKEEVDEAFRTNAWIKVSKDRTQIE